VTRHRRPPRAALGVGDTAALSTAPPRSWRARRHAVGVVRVARRASGWRQQCSRCTDLGCRLSSINKRQPAVRCASASA